MEGVPGFTANIEIQIVVVVFGIFLSASIKYLTSVLYVSIIVTWAKVAIPIILYMILLGACLIARVSVDVDVDLHLYFVVWCYSLVIDWLMNSPFYAIVSLVIFGYIRRRYVPPNWKPEDEESKESETKPLLSSNSIPQSPAPYTFNSHMNINNGENYAHPQPSAPPMEASNIPTQSSQPVYQTPQPPPSTANYTQNRPLPPGWTFAYDVSGRIYFLDHNTRTTTYSDPRLTS